MAGNMEDLLLGDDDDSDSDNEEVRNVPAAASAVAATVQPTTSPTPQQQQQPQQQPPQNQAPPQNKSELSQRLKSLYSPASQSHAKKQVAPPQQQHQQQQAPGQTRPPSLSSSTGSSGRPQTMPHHSQQQPQQPAHAQRQSSQDSSHSRLSSQQVPAQNLPRGFGGIKHQISTQHPQQQQQQQGYSSSSQQSHHSQQHQHPSYSSQRHSQSQSQQPSSHHPQQQHRSQYQQQPQYRSSSSSQHRSSTSSGGSGSSRPPMQHRTSGSSVPNPVPVTHHHHGGGTLPPPGQRRSGVSTSSHDPFEPTPLNKIRPSGVPHQRSSQGGSTGGSQRSTQGAGGYSSAASSVSTVPTSNVAAPSSAQTEREKEMRRQKEKFLMFTRVLMKYLETKDIELHRKVKNIIRDCADRNKRQEVGYESVTASMRARLKEEVGDSYWKRAESYLAHFLAQKQKQGGGGGGSSSSSTSKQPGGSGVDMNAAQLEAAKRKSELERRMEQKKMLERQQAAQLHQQQQQQQQQRSQQPQQQQQMQMAASQVAEPAPSPAPSTKGGKAASTGGGKGKRAGGKQSGTKAPKKPRKASTATGGRGSKTASAAAAATAATQTTPPPPQQQIPTTLQQQQLIPAQAPIEQPAPPPPPVREYSELMECIDHAVHFDWTTAGLIMGTSAQKIQLQEEQKNLLYSSAGGISAAISATPATPVVEWKRESGTDGMTGAIDSQQEGDSSAESHESTKSTKIPAALRGWGSRNVVSPRVAWSRLRRREHRTPEQRARFNLIRADAPDTLDPATAWVNEEKAEDDAALCLLSEATQVYVTQILQKALVCARQRQNLDGIRLWHQQCTTAVEIAKAAKDETAEKPTPPPLSIRLGCDVQRQIARSMGNAALTCKRMEEALERQKTDEVTRVVPSKVAPALNEATIASAQSMGELSLLPPLSTGAEKADYEAKRAFEVYGGKFSREPPFGRVPKRATLEAIDFQQSLQMDSFLGGRGNRRHRARPNAFF